VRRAELDRADYIVAMDRHNVSDLQWLASQGALDGRLSLLLSHTEGGAAVLDVPDPYYTGNFEEVYRLVETACTGLLAHIRRERGL
jgi:protein-tyrosine phosphatase